MYVEPGFCGVTGMPTAIPTPSELRSRREDVRLVRRAVHPRLDHELGVEVRAVADVLRRRWSRGSARGLQPLLERRPAGPVVLEVAALVHVLRVPAGHRREDPRALELLQALLAALGVDEAQDRGGDLQPAQRRWPSAAAACSCTWPARRGRRAAPPRSRPRRRASPTRPRRRRRRSSRSACELAVAAARQDDDRDPCGGPARRKMKGSRSRTGLAAMPKPSEPARADARQPARLAELHLDAR